MPTSKRPLIIGGAGLFIALLSLAFIAQQWIAANRQHWPDPRSEEGLANTLTYNIISHGIFLVALAAILAWLVETCCLSWHNLADEGTIRA